MYSPSKLILQVCFLCSATALKAGNTDNITYNDSTFDVYYERLHFAVDPAVRFISGNVTFYFTLQKDTATSITVSLSDSLVVDSILYHSGKAVFLHGSGLVKIYSVYNKKDSVTVFYHGVPPDVPTKSFYLRAHKEDTVMWTLSEPYGSFTWMPAKIGLKDKIDSLDMIVTVPLGNRVAGNGLLISEDSSATHKTVHWKHTYPIEPYLIAFAVTNYVAYSDYALLRGKNLEILNYVYPESYQYADTNTPALIPVMQWLDSLFIPYPFMREKYGHAQISLTGAMEHQTMTFTSYFYLDILVHELVHQWFGNYITCASWNDIWLNEGFAEYFEAVSHERGFNKDFKGVLEAMIKNITKLPNGSVYVPNVDTVGRIFNYRLTYAKGAMILHMLRWEIGDEAFFGGIRDYLNDPKLAYSYATFSDFKKHIEAASGRDLTEFFNDWYYGEGFPNYNIQWKQVSADNAEMTLFQYPSHNSVSFFGMKVPVKFIGESRDTTLVFQHNYSGETFSFAPGFVVKQIVFDPDRHILTPHNDSLYVTAEIESDSVSLFPNPSRENIFIKIPPRSLLYSCRIIDVNGVVCRMKYDASELNIFRIDISAFANGIYYLELNISGKNVRKKFVKI